MRCSFIFALVALTTTSLFAAEVKTRRIAVDEYRDKMAAGWIGQMIGVGTGAPTEFKYNGRIIPEGVVPAWKPKMINQFNQDDIYVEMTFLETLAKYGPDVSSRQAGIDFANSGYRLWHANLYGRKNLRAGIAPPDSGHPKFNGHADDIDYQIEADFSGLISPGMPNEVIRLGNVFGQMMNYGDGVYGGQFVGGMIAESFFETDMRKIVEAGLACIPKESQYAECIRDVLTCYDKYPDDWKKTWVEIDKKYQRDPNYRRFSCKVKRRGEGFNIDAKINGAYIVIGMLYGKRDMRQTVVISCRCGHDSDCNPSSAAGILATTIGLSKLPECYTSALDRKKVFSHTSYNFPKLLEVCESLARRIVVQRGGRIEKDASGREFFVIPVAPPKPNPCVQCWDPKPATGARYTEEEMRQIVK
jgi:hypothetical protein